MSEETAERVAYRILALPGNEREILGYLLGLGHRSTDWSSPEFNDRLACRVGVYRAEALAAQRQRK